MAALIFNVTEFRLFGVATYSKPCTV